MGGYAFGGGLSALSPQPCKVYPVKLKLVSALSSATSVG
jgi:hypothetical protein